MEMGTGKTRTALEMIKRRIDEGKLSHVLWLCPCSTISNLKAEFDKHTSDWECIISTAGIESLSGSMKLYQELLMRIAGKDVMLVVDESNLVKNHLAIRSRRIIDIARRCKYRIILNGTPISQSEKDLYAQWYLLDWRILGYQSFWSFAANHLEYDPERKGRIRRTLHVDYLTEKIAPYSYQVSRSECMMLPEKKYYNENTDLTFEQERHYDEVLNYMLDKVSEQRPETIYRMFAALQAVISGRYVSLGGRMITYPMFQSPKDNPRIRTLMRLLSTCYDNKVIIFCKYTSEINDIKTMLGNKAAIYNGDLALKQRAKSLAEFSADAQYLICNKQCAGYGLNLQFCHELIFYSNDWDYATRIQAEDRVHRIGQKEEVHITDICASGTLDAKIIRCLDGKESLLDSLKQKLNKSNDVREDLRAWAKGVIDNGENIHADKRV